MGWTPSRPSSHQEAEPLTPVCGPSPTPHRLNASNVLLIGDSISMGALESLDGDEMGYGAAVSRMLERMGAVHVQHNGGWSDAGQAGPSSKGVRCIRHWLGRERWDVVHANFGLHDIARARGYNWSAVPPHAYVESLDAIFRHVQASLKPGGQFVWATTTPVPQSLRLAGAAPGSALSRNNSAVLEYNRLAAGLWASKRPGAVVVNDLYSLVTKRCGHRGRYGSFYRCALQRLWPSPLDADVHFNQEGREYLALAVASVIAQQLPCLHQARPHSAVVAANTAAAARRGGREAHHGKHTSRRRRRRLVATDSQPPLRSSSASRHATGSVRFRRAAVVLSPPDARVTAGGEPDARWRRTLRALKRTGAFAHVLRHTPPAIAVTATSSPLRDDGSDASAATVASTFASSTTSTSAAAASPAATSPAARARLASLLRRHGCRVVQSTLFGFSSLLRRFASHPLTARVEWLYVFEDDAALVRPDLTAAQVEAALVTAERTADHRGVPMVYGGWCAARRECEQYDEPPAAPCPPSSAVASGPFHATRAQARRFFARGLFARHALTGEAPARCAARAADLPRAASCAGLCAHSFAVRARALRGEEEAAVATATAAGGNSDGNDDGLGARSTPLLDELLGSYLPDGDSVNALLVPFDRRLYTYARAKGGLPTALSDECRNASGGGGGGGGGGAGFCGLFSQDRRASPQDAKVVSEPCNPHSRTAYHHELMRRVAWGQTAPAPPHTMRVACVGDSLTRGDGAHLGGAVRRRIALFGNYPMRLQQALGGGGGSSGGAAAAAKKAGAEAWLVRNFGRGGSTAIAGNQTLACHGYTTTAVGTGTGARPHTRAYLGSAEFHAALQLLPHVVLLMLGSNDSTEPCWDGEAFSRGLHELVHAFRALPSRPALVLLVPPAPRHDGAARAEFGIRGAVVRKEVAQRVRALVRVLAAGASEAAAAPIATTATAATATAMACLPGTVHLLDMHHTFRQHGCADPASARCAALFANDSLHTSRAGADLIANTARPLVASCDRRRWAAPPAAPPAVRQTRSVERVAGVKQARRFVAAASSQPTTSGRLRHVPGPSPRMCSRADSLLLTACEAAASRTHACGRVLPLAPLNRTAAYWGGLLEDASTQTPPVLSWSGIQRLVQGGQCRALERDAPNLRFSSIRATAVRLPSKAFADGPPRSGSSSTPPPLQHASRLVEEENGALDLAQLVHVLTPAVVSSIRVKNFGSGVVFASAPALVLDLSGGCCRPTPRTCWPRCDDDAAARECGWWGCQHGHEFARNAALDAVRGVASGGSGGGGEWHEWLYVALHSHSATYYHATAQTLPRLMWAHALLLAETRIRVAHESRTLDALLPFVGLGGRGVLITSRGVAARRLTIAPAADLHGLDNDAHPPWVYRTRALRAAITRAGPALIRHSLSRDGVEEEDGEARAPPPDRHGPAAGTIVIVRRVARGRKGRGDRAVRNHAELMAAVRAEWPTALVSEFLPSASVAQTVATFTAATLVIGVHGAGLSNVLFATRRLTLVELIWEQQPGWGTFPPLIAPRRGSYVNCTYASPRAGPPLSPDSDVTLDIPAVFACMRRHRVSPRPT